MTVFYSAEAQLQYPTTGQRSMPPGAVYGGRLRRYRNVITLASQATTDTIQLGDVPPGNVFAFGVLTTDTSLGSSTIAIGYTGTVGAYRAAAVFTATNTPTLFGVVADQVKDPATAAKAIILPFITIAAATMPASGTLVVDLYFSGV